MPEFQIFGVFFILATNFLQFSLGHHLSVHPQSVLFLDEDWPIGRPLDVQICSDRRADSQPLDVAILAGNEPAKEGQPPPFGLIQLNESCIGLVLNVQLDAEQNVILPENDGIPTLAQSNAEVGGIEEKEEAGSRRLPSSSYSLLLEDMDTRARATLQIELMDVNDNSPTFVAGGPFPLELFIPADSPEGLLLRRLEVTDPDGGIGGISRFFLDPTFPTPSSANLSRRLFSLEGQQCHWPRCWVELRLKAKLTEGQRHGLRVKARDGAGLTQKRANEASADLWIMAVEEHEHQNQKEEEEKNQLESGITVNHQEFGLLEGNHSSNEEKADFSAKIEEVIRPEATTIASLITFDPKASSHRRLMSGRTTSTTTATTDLQYSNPDNPITRLPNSTELPDGWDDRFRSSSSNNAFSSVPTPPPSPLPQPTRFLINPLVEDSPIGLELIRIPLPLNHLTSLNFIQLDGSQSLRMLPNGSVQIAAELDAEKVPELRAEVRDGAEGRVLAILQAKVRPMREAFRQWMDRLFSDKGNRQITQAELSNGHPLQILRLPLELAKYAQIDTMDEPGWQLERQNLLLTNLEKPGNHCCQLEFIFRTTLERRRICVEIPEREIPLEIHWPANNSRHYFLENEPIQVLLTLNASGPPTLIFSIDQSFEDGLSFSIGPENGQLSVRANSSFDYETKNQYSLAIHLCPNQTLAYEEKLAKCYRIRLFVEVLDANDHCPEFEGILGEEAKMAISEAVPPDSSNPFGQFQRATDGDGSSDQRSICYKLEDSKGGTFGVERERPELFLLKPLDRELVAAYQLQVLAEDCPWIDHKCLSQTGVNTTNSSISLTILVTDVNDNPPRFERRHFFAALHVDNNNIQAGEAAIQLRAKDPDEGDRGRLRFGWGEGMVQTDGDPLPIADCPFNLNRSSGEISLRHDLGQRQQHIADAIDRRTYTFRVRVRDKGPPVAHEDQASVTISVIDPKRHLLQMLLATDGAQLEPQFGQLERYLSSLLAEQGWMALVHQLIECGGPNCTELSVYFLDRLFLPVDEKLALEALKRVERDEPRAMAELRRKFGLIQMGESLHSTTSPSAGHNNGFYQLIRRLFSISSSPFGLFLLALLTALSLACPFLCCRLCCRRCNGKNRHQHLLMNKRILGGYGGLRLVMPGNSAANKNAIEAKGVVEFLSEENAYKIAGEMPENVQTNQQPSQQRRLRWKTESEEFEFPAPPPVRMYGSSGTMSIPRLKTTAAVAGTNAISTEF